MSYLQKTTNRNREPKQVARDGGNTPQATIWENSSGRKIAEVSVYAVTRNSRYEMRVRYYELQSLRDAIDKAIAVNERESLFSLEKESEIHRLIGRSLSPEEHESIVDFIEASGDDDVDILLSECVRKENS